MKYLNYEGFTYFVNKIKSIFATKEELKAKTDLPQGGTDGQVLKSNGTGGVVWGTDNDTKYTHPTSHPATMITETTAKKFVSDAQITEWNNKVEQATFDNEMRPFNGNLYELRIGQANNFIMRGSNLRELVFPAIDKKQDKIEELTDFNVTYNAHDTENTEQLGLALSKVYEEIDNGQNKVTTINGKTGVISKEDIVALGIPAEDKDTVYTHPSSHPASMITESTTKRFVSDTEKTTWNGKQDKLTAGEGINIDGNTISTSANTGGGIIDSGTIAGPTQMGGSINWCITDTKIAYIYCTNLKISTIGTAGIALGDKLSCAESSMRPNSAIFGKDDRLVGKMVLVNGYLNFRVTSTTDYAESWISYPVK